MYTAFELVTLLHSISSKITAICANGDTIYLGTSTGDVEVYNVKEPEPEKQEAEQEPMVEESREHQPTEDGAEEAPTLELEAEEPQPMGPQDLAVRVNHVNMELGKKAIEQLLLVPKLNHLVVLCVRNATTLEVIFRLEELRGATCCCLRTNFNGPPALCFSVKRQLVILECREDKYIMSKEYFIPDSAVSLAWSDDMLCVGFRREYSLVNSENGAVSDLVTAMRELPLARHVSEDSFLMVSQKIGAWMDCEEEKPNQIGTLNWPSSPYALGFCYPFAIAVLSDRIDIRCIQEESIQQTIDIEKGKHSVLSDEGGCIYVVTSGKLFALRPVPVDQQVNQLLALNRVQEALNLLDRTAEGAASRKKGVPPADTEFLVSARGLQLLVSRCADIVSISGPYTSRNFVPELLSADVAAPVFINHFLQYLVEHDKKSDQVVAACLTHLRDPSIKPSRLMCLLFLLSQTVARSEKISPKVLEEAMEMIRPFYLWPSPYGDFARNVLQLLRNEQKHPGQTFAKRLAHHEKSRLCHGFYDVNSLPAEIWRTLLSEPPIAPTPEGLQPTASPVQRPQSPGSQTAPMTPVELSSPQTSPATSLGVDAPISTVSPKSPHSPLLAASPTPSSLGEQQRLDEAATAPRSSSIETAEPPQSAIEEIPLKAAPFCPEQSSLLDFELEDHEVNISNEERDLAKRQHLSDAHVLHSTAYDALSTIMSTSGENSRVRLVIAGDDDTLHSVLCAYVAFHFMNPRLAPTIDTRWYLVPLAQDNEVTMFVGHYDGWYARHMLFAYQSIIALVGAQRGIESYGRQDNILNALTGTRRPEDPCTAVQTPAVNPATTVRRCLQTYLTEAANVISIPIYSCEMYSPQSAKMFWTVPFCRRLDIGLTAAAHVYKLTHNIPIDTPVEKVEQDKKFKFDSVKLKTKWTRCTLMGVQEEPVIETHAIRSITVSNMPSPDCPHITPEGPYLFVTYTEKQGSSRRKSIVASKAATETQFSVSSMTLEAEGEKGFDVLCDGVPFGPVKRIMYG